MRRWSRQSVGKSIFYIFLNVYTQVQNSGAAAIKHYFKFSVLGNVRIWCKLYNISFLAKNLWKWFPLNCNRILFSLRSSNSKESDVMHSHYAFGLSELNLENKKCEKRFLHLKKNWYHRTNFKCPFLNQGDVPYRKTKVSLKAYFIDFFF